MLFCIRDGADDEKTDVEGEVASQQGEDLAADDTPDASLLANGRRVVNADMFHEVALETAIGPEPVRGEIPKEHDTNGKELGNVIAD